MRLYSVDDISVALGVSTYTVQRWMKQGKIVFRVWYRGRGQVARAVEANRLREFMDAHMPEFDPESNHRACQVWKWRSSAGRKGQASMIRNYNIAKRNAQGSGKSEPD